MCRATAVKNLFVPVILGLPFYVVKKCSIDPVRSTVVRQDNGLDVIHAPPHISLPPPPSPLETRELEYLRDRLARTAYRDTLRELLLIRAPTPPVFDPNLSPSSSPAFASHTRRVCAAINDRISELALLDSPQREDASLRSQFADPFPDDIPHISHLPTDVYHRFRPKDPNAVITRRQYDCPKKYRDAWRTLLNQHLEAGHIRLSSSP
jgi:hypothetical protein